MRSDNFLYVLIFGLIVAIIIAAAFGGNYLIHQLTCGSSAYFDGTGWQCPRVVIVKP